MPQLADKLSELERYCMTGPNKGKPGPCPEDSGPSSALDSAPWFIRGGKSKPKTEEKKPDASEPGKSAPSGSDEHEQAKGPMHVAAKALEASQEIWDTISATGEGAEGPIRIIGDFTARSIPHVRKAIVKYHAFLEQRYGDKVSSRIMAFGIAASMTTDIPFPAIHALPLSEYFHSLPALAFAEFCLRSKKCGPLESVMVRLNNLKNKIPGHEKIGRGVSKAVHGYHKIKGLGGKLTRKVIGAAARGALKVGQAAAPEYGKLPRTAPPVFSEGDSDSALIQREGKKFAKYVQTTYANLLIKHEKELLPAAKAVAEAYAKHKKLKKYCELSFHAEGQPCKPGETAAKDRCIPKQKQSSNGVAQRQQPEEQTPKEEKAPTEEEGQKPTYVDGDIKMAAKLLSQGKRVQMDQPEQVSTLLDRIDKMVQKAVKMGDKAPAFDLCKVTVPGTNLFCQETKGVPRIQMPQMRGMPEDGSVAATRPKNSIGKVDISKDFIESLRDKDIRVTQLEIRASHLRASQNEIDGSRVAFLVKEAANGKDLRKRPIFVTRDNYVLDGHHHWAALVGLGYSKDKDLKVPVYKLDIDIGTGIHEANTFAKKMGIKQKSVAHAETFAENAKLRNQQIFTTGMHRNKVYNHRDLDQMVENWKLHSSGAKPTIRVPAVIGHEESQEFLDNSGIPAAGWVSGLRNVKNKCPVCKGGGKVGGESGPGTCPKCAGTGVASTLYADFDDVPRQVAKLVNRKAYRTVSSEIYDRPPEGVPGEGKVLRRVAFLGGEIPQIKSLDDIGTLYEHRETGESFLRSGMPTSLLLTRVHKPWPNRRRPWHTAFAEVQPMSREEMIEKLTKEYGFNREVLDKMPDEGLAEILRVYDSSAGGGEEEGGEGEEIPVDEGMGGGAQQIPEEGEEEGLGGEGAGGTPQPEELDEQEHSLLGKIGEQPRGGETPAGHLGSATQEHIHDETGSGEGRESATGEDDEFELPEPKTPEEAKHFAAYAQKAFKRVRRAVQKYCGKQMGETLNSGDTDMLTGPEHAHEDPKEPEKAGYNLPAAGGRQPKKVTMSAQYSEQTTNLRTIIRQELSTLLKSGLQRDVNDLQKFREELKVSAKEEAVNAILDRNKRKILPVQREMFRELLMGADCRAIVSKFKEKNGSTRDLTRFDQLALQLDRMPDLLLEKFREPFDGKANGPNVEDWAEQTYTKHQAAFKKMGGMTKSDFIAMAKKADNEGGLQKFREQWDQAPVQAA